MRWFLIFMCLAVPAQAEGLMGRVVTVWVETTLEGDTTAIEDPVNQETVSSGLEFGLGGVLDDGLYIVPVFVDVGARHIEMVYASGEPGTFLDAEFNGYVFAFDQGCAELRGATVNAAGTTMALDNDDLTVTATELRVNVEGLDYDEGMRVLIDLKIGDCVST